MSESIKTAVFFFFVTIIIYVLAVNPEGVSSFIKSLSSGAIGLGATLQGDKDVQFGDVSIGRGGGNRFAGAGRNLGRGFIGGFGGGFGLPNGNTGITGRL